MKVKTKSFMTEPLKAIDSSLEKKKRKHIIKAVASLYSLKERMNKNIDLISLITETESWNEAHHVTLCLRDCEETIDAIKNKIKEIESTLQ